MSKIQITFESDANYGAADIVNLNEEFASFIEEFDEESSAKSIKVVDITELPDGTKLTKERQREIAFQLISSLGWREAVYLIIDAKGDSQY